jgi:hypothetical protein
LKINPFKASKNDLDRTAHKAYHFKNQLPESADYRGLSLQEIAEVFNYLQSAAYNFKLNDYPKMDKSIHSCRKINVVKK